jgi:metallo-beta-lactamase family protein
MQTVQQLDKTKLKQVFLVHGEVQSMDALAAALEEEDYPVTVPQKGIVYELN